jgi:hypothetical protein
MKKNIFEPNVEKIGLATGHQLKRNEKHFFPTFCA